MSNLLFFHLAFLVQLSVERAIDEQNTLIPSISLLSGSAKYSWLRRWPGGSLRTSLHPGTKLSFDWRDGGFMGDWITKAEVPFEDPSHSKVTVTRDWKF